MVESPTLIREWINKLDSSDFKPSVVTDCLLELKQVCLSTCSIFQLIHNGIYFSNSTIRVEIIQLGSDWLLNSFSGTHSAENPNAHNEWAKDAKICKKGPFSSGQREGRGLSLLLLQKMCFTSQSLAEHWVWWKKLIFDLVG